MRIHIEQNVEPDEMGLERDHPDYEGWRDGAVNVWSVRTKAICLETGRKGEDALWGITTPVDDDSYLRTIKAEQIQTVLAEIGFDLDFDSNDEE